MNLLPNATSGGGFYSFQDIPMLNAIAKRMIDAANNKNSEPTPQPDDQPARPRVASDAAQISPRARALAIKDQLPTPPDPVPLPAPRDPGNAPPRITPIGPPRFDGPQEVPAPREAPAPGEVPPPRDRTQVREAQQAPVQPNQSASFDPFEGNRVVEGTYSSDPLSGGEFQIDGVGVVGTFDSDGNISFGDFEGRAISSNIAVVTNSESGESYEFRFASGEGRFRFYGIQEVTSAEQL